MAPPTIEISTKEQLLEIAHTMGSAKYPYDGTYILTQDINMEGAAIPPIAQARYAPGPEPTKEYTTHAFRGIFDGQGYTISHFTLDLPEEENTLVGFFSAISSPAKIRNLTLSKVTVDINPTTTSSPFYASGILVGFAYGRRSRITNCCVKDSRIHAVSSRVIGGFAGRVRPYVTLTGCSVENVSVIGKRHVAIFVAALAGKIDSASIINSEACGKERVGGFTGSGSGTIINSTIEASKLYAEIYLGAMAGWFGAMSAKRETPSIVECTAQDVMLLPLPSGDKAEHFGGLVGQLFSANVTESTFSGEITGNWYLGGGCGSLGERAIKTPDGNERFVTAQFSKCKIKGDIFLRLCETTKGAPLKTCGTLIGDREGGIVEDNQGDVKIRTKSGNQITHHPPKEFGSVTLRPSEPKATTTNDSGVASPPVTQTAANGLLFPSRPVVKIRAPKVAAHLPGGPRPR